ncbi:MAG TPA: hypothetical protein VFW74_16530 [Acidimicrobiia bacterium]|nr:hypothetical protein [Acidimicrobiia bacterium]
MFAHDFIQVDREFGAARAALLHDSYAVLERCTRETLGAAASIDVGDARDRDDIVVVPVRLACSDVSCPFRVLDGDVQVAPLDDDATHVSIAVTFEPRVDDLPLRSTVIADHRRTEKLLRSFLAALAAELERPRHGAAT